ncbi:MAG: hypothetical protein H6Q00_3372 [Holophagaceae bacterium]|nr:hypothetical protein [Holophagaceae bacterium]
MVDCGFDSALFGFLADLAANNSTPWFQAHRQRFEDEVRTPMLGFILAVSEPLAAISPYFEANPARSGGSMFRINRDIRFTPDKRPYKTHVGAQFRHRECPRDVHSPGFYLHLEPGGCFVGAGLWRPDPKTLQRVREQIVAHPQTWTALTAEGLTVQGESATRVPRGFDPTHPLAGALKLKDYYTAISLSEAQVCHPDFLGIFSSLCRQQAPLVHFLAEALDLAW